MVSAFFLMCVPNCDYGLNGTFIFADSGLVQNPTDIELASIAKESADSFKLLTKADPWVAFISYSTKGSAKHADVDKVIRAVKYAKEKYPDYNMDGELQVDAAIVPDVARSKAPGSLVAGRANVLIFPAFDAVLFLRSFFSALLCLSDAVPFLFPIVCLIKYRLLYRLI